MSGWKLKTRRGKLDVGQAASLWWRFLPFVRSYMFLLVGAGLAAFAAVFMQLAAPWPIQWVFDFVLGQQPAPAWLGETIGGGMDRGRGILVIACAAILLIGALEAVFSHVRDVTLADVGQRVVGKMRRHLFAHLQSLPPSVFESRRTGDLLMRITGDIQMLRVMLVGAVVTLAQSGVTILALVVAMVWLNPFLAAMGLATIPITFMAGWRISKKIHKASKDQRDKESAVANIAHDVLGAMSIIQAFNRQEIERRRFSRHERSTVRAGLKTTRLESKLYRTVSMASAASTCAILYFGVDAVLKNTMSAGELLVFVAYLRSVSKPIRQLTKITGQLAKSTTCAERIAEILSISPAICDEPGARTIADVRGSIAFERVSFAYDARGPALHDIDLTINPGERVSIVGRSGAGKSTLAKLLLRFYDPQNGHIRIDGHELREFTLESLRRCIGWVHQDTILFGMSVAENIALGVPDASAERIREVARCVDADEFIQALPRQYETVLGQAGSTLSGGQRQRIALARALLHNPSILVLDEPATGLDSRSRSVVEEAWLSRRNSATTLVICHRLRAMERFDRIVVLRDGRICEIGTHDDLLARNGEYHSLWTASTISQDQLEKLAC